MAETVTVRQGDRVLCLSSTGLVLSEPPRIEGSHRCAKDDRIKELGEVLEDVRLEYARAFDRERQAVAAIGIIVERALARKEKPVTHYDGSESVREHARKVAALTGKGAK